MKTRVAVVGATGLVGAEMLRVLERRLGPQVEVRALASARSRGREITYLGSAIPVELAAPEAFEGVDYALFSAGSGPSKELSPAAAAAGAIVIDNSSAFRADPEVPLVIPEVNAHALDRIPKGIIANPNCSTIQMLVALAPLHREATIERIVVSTYQAISGAGKGAVDALRAQERALASGAPISAESHATLQGQLAGNLLMHWSRSDACAYQEEELKMVTETKKILEAPAIQVSPTCVRVPVITGHSESIAIELTQPLSAERARELLRASPGIKVHDDFQAGIYPTPLDAAGHDAVWVGRIREDLGHPRGLLLWVVGDNLLKGAALNAVQILETLMARSGATPSAA